MSTDISFRILKSKLSKQLNSLPVLIGNEMVNYALENFKNEAYDGNKWKPRKKKQKGKSQQKILVGRTRRLIRGNRFTTIANGVRYINDTPYASIHNFGGVISRAARSETFIRNRHQKGRLGKMFGGKGAFAKGTTKGQGFTFKSYKIHIPQRQFIGRSPVLLTRLKTTAINHLRKAF
ncbi:MULTISPECIES: phage virion morphogenesis protein [Olivibacter]|uniref:Phage virion morphogenesis protein n=1 Tax=Olivibacter jilunii TaxID=985016 RepID=A0ABW6AWY5_9SPHI